MNMMTAYLMSIPPLFGGLYVLKMNEINRLIINQDVKKFYGLSYVDFYILAFVGFTSGTLFNLFTQHKLI